MSNGMFNSFLILIGFCLLGLPIILISVTTAPPGLDQYNSSIIINTIEGDAQSVIVLNNVTNINGSSPYWDDIAGLPEIVQLSNLTQLIDEEMVFMENVSIMDYYGLSKKVHVFELEMTIHVAPSTSSGAKDSYATIFGDSNGTFLTWKRDYDDWNSSHAIQPFYPSPSINDTLDTVYGAETIEYEIIIHFNANIEINGIQKATEFSRLIYINDAEELIFFLSDEYGWSTVT